MEKTVKSALLMMQSALKKIREQSDRISAEGDKIAEERVIVDVDMYSIQEVRDLLLNILLYFIIKYIIIQIFCQ